MAAAEKEIEAPEKEELSLREQLIAARDESQSRQEKEQEAPLKAETPAPEQGEPPPESPPSQPIPEPKPEIKAPAMPAPRSWSAEEKPLWTKVPLEVQAVINRREADFHRKVTENDEVRSAGTQFMTAANKYAQVIQARGTTPAAYFEQLLGIVHQLDSARTPQDRAAVFEQIARQQGVDLRQVLGSGSQNGPTQFPQMPLQTIVQQTVQQQFEALQARQEREREQAVMQATTGEIEAFRSKVNEQGLPAYPYFDHVVNLMAGLVQSGTATTLEEAYTLAVRAHPETSKLIADAEQAEAKAKEAKRLAAEKAKRKGGSVRGGPGSNSTGQPGDRTIRDELRAAFEESRSRI